MELERGERRRRRGGRVGLWLALLLVLALGVLSGLRVGGVPEIEIEPEVPALGPGTPITVRVAEPRRGLEEIRVELVQGENSTSLARETYDPRGALAFWADATEEDVIEVVAGRETMPTLQEGEASVRVTAGRAGTWLRSPEPVTSELTLPVHLRPPTVSVLSDQHYLRQGGSEAVVYRVGDSSVRDGVQVRDRFFPGFPLPGGEPGERFALVGAPWDLFEGSEVVLVAEDRVGNRARVPFLDLYKPRPYQSGRIQLSDDFLEAVVPEILAQTPSLEDLGDPLENYLQINGELRARNRARLVELAERSRETFRWHAPFLQMPNAAVMSPFAVERSYLYDGEEVDRQFHLGYDLATVRRDEVPAANEGVVLVAEYFGIYGNAVILDHGYGLMSLYGHLSSLSVEEGEEVRRGQTLGRSGDTGLAGGDHLHFAILLQGMPVDPVEWWDESWIANRIGRKLGPASPLQ